MKKFIISTTIIILATISIIAYLYISSVKPLKSLEKVAIAKAKEVVSFQEIDEITIFNGKETSYTVRGIDKNNDEIIVFIPEKDGQTIVKKATEGITKEDAIAIVENEKAPEKIVSVKLGMEKQIPLWEVYYKSKGSSLNYYYIDFRTGEWLKKIENL